MRTKGWWVGAWIALALCASLAACSCNGQRYTNGPDSACKPDALLAEMKAMYSDLVSKLYPVNNDCTAITNTLNTWLDANEQRFLQLHKEEKTCATRHDDKELPKLVGALVLAVDPCRAHSEPAREANDRLIRAADGEVVSIDDQSE